jgi:hypothetical protein
MYTIDLALIYYFFTSFKSLGLEMFNDDEFIQNSAITAVIIKFMARIATGIAIDRMGIMVGIYAISGLLFSASLLMLTASKVGFFASLVAF